MEMNRRNFLKAAGAAGVASAALSSVALADEAAAEVEYPKGACASDYECSPVEVAPITEEEFSAHLDTADVADPDLLIRTSGEMCISNFLLWQIAYSEIYVTPVLWPDFDRYEFLRAILSYQGRSRRFGGV